MTGPGPHRSRRGDTTGNGAGTFANWTEAELDRADAMTRRGADHAAIGAALGRSARAIQNRLYRYRRDAAAHTQAERAAAAKDRKADARFIEAGRKASGAGLA